MTCTSKGRPGITVASCRATVAVAHASTIAVCNGSTCISVVAIVTVAARVTVVAAMVAIVAVVIVSAVVAVAHSPVTAAVVVCAVEVTSVIP